MSKIWDFVKNNKILMTGLTTILSALAGLLANYKVGGEKLEQNFPTLISVLGGGVVAAGVGHGLSRRGKVAVQPTLAAIEQKDLESIVHLRQRARTIPDTARRQAVTTMLDQLTAECFRIAEDEAARAAKSS